jgi:hypothetical protein
MWGVYELVELRRAYSGGDVYPETQQAFYLPEINQVFEPTFKARWFKTMGDFAMGMEGWGMTDYRPFLDQLAKLKFNHPGRQSLAAVPGLADPRHQRQSAALQPPLSDLNTAARPATLRMKRILNPICRHRRPGPADRGGPAALSELIA